MHEKEYGISIGESLLTGFFRRGIDIQDKTAYDKDNIYSNRIKISGLQKNVPQKNCTVRKV
jgi:hypothetical protein